MTFIPNTEDERNEMLGEIGLRMQDLFADIPESVADPDINLPTGVSEQEACEKLAEIADKNNPQLLSFLGAGFYDHYVPAAVDALSQRGEFFTAYTPYQPEASQGTLQAVYEWQSCICRLTDMVASNASMYDGGTAMYESVMMALRLTRKKNRVLVDTAVSPVFRKILATHIRNVDFEVVEIPHNQGTLDRERLQDAIDDNTAAVVLQTPNFFGTVDDYSDIAEKIHAKKGMMIVCTYPVALGMIKTPGEMGADIVAGEAQSLGMPLSFGGPYLGFMATTQKNVRKMPGRIAGETEDTDGKRGYVLTLQAREQHIRREKATSNICSNEALCALKATIFLSLLGKEGFTELAERCAQKAAYAFDRLTAIEGVSAYTPEDSFFNEFVLTLPEDANAVASRLLNKNIAAGLPLKGYYPDLQNALLIAVTEKRTKGEIDRLASELEAEICN